jgi:hypothetical protein
MAFTDYKDIAQVLEEFQIQYQRGEFIQAREVAVSQTFLDEFNFTINNIDVRSSEYTIGEALLFPILREAYKKYAGHLAFWSHKTIRYNKKLSGMPDYMFATKSQLGPVVLGKPLLVMVEAKKNDFDEGWGQCLAGLVAAQKLNDNEQIALYGIVSDGKSWEFGQLQATNFTKNVTDFHTANLPLLFGALDFMLALASRQIEESGV